MKKLWFLLIVLALISSFALTAGAQEKMSIRLGHIRDTNHPTHMAALKFKDMVSQKSAGRIEVKVFPNSQLGGPKEMFAQMQTGDLEMVYGGINTFAWIKGGEAYEITAIPFLFRDYAHMSKALLSDFFKPIQEKAEKDTGIKVITINGDTAPRGLSTRDKPVYNADDFKGMKIRTAASPTVLAAMKTLGALPQQIAFSGTLHGSQDRNRGCSGEWGHRCAISEPFRSPEILYEDRLHSGYRNLLHGHAFLE